MPASDEFSAGRLRCLAGRAGASPRAALLLAGRAAQTKWPPLIAQRRPLCRACLAIRPAISLAALATIPLAESGAASRLGATALRRSVRPFLRGLLHCRTGRFPFAAPSICMAALAGWFTDRPCPPLAFQFLPESSNWRSSQTVNRSFPLAFPPPSIPGYK